MADKFIVSGLKELERDLLKLGAVGGVKALRAAGRSAMKPVLTAAIAGAHEDTGDLRKSLAIRAKKGKGKTVVVISVGGTRKKDTKANGGGMLIRVNQKAIAQEYGTARQKADPFLAPAMDSNVERVLAIFSADLGKQIDKAVKG